LYIYIAARNNTATLAADAVLEQQQQCSPSPSITKRIENVSFDIILSDEIYTLPLCL
jgi:hypothetical protein